MTLDHGKSGECVLKSLWQFRSAGCLCDLVIKTEDYEILAHKVIIAAWSPQLKIQFEEQFCSSQQRSELKTVVLYDGLDYASLLAVVKFMYGGILEIVRENFAGIQNVAKVLDVPAVAKICEEYAQKHAHDNSDNSREQTLNFSGKTVNESASLHIADGFQRVHRLPVITEIFFGERHGKVSSAISALQDVNNSALQSRTGVLSQESPQTHETEVTESEVRISCAKDVSEDRNDSLSDFTSKESENSTERSDNSRDDFRCRTQGAVPNATELSCIENCGSNETDSIKDSECDAREPSLSKTENDSHDNQKEKVNCDKPKRKRGRPRKVKLDQLDNHDNSLVRTTRSISKSSVKDLSKSDGKMSKVVTRKLRKRNGSLHSSQSAKDSLKTDRSIPVKKRKLREIKLKAVKKFNRPRRLRNSDHKVKSDMNDDESENEENDDNKEENDDNNRDESCKEGNDDNDSDENEYDNRKPHKKKRLRIYEKQASMYDLSFERFEREFVDLYGLLRCHRCSAEFKDRAALYLHIDNCEVETSVPVLPIYCPQCDTDFSSNEDLMTHRAEYHTGRRPGGRKNPQLHRTGTLCCHLCDSSYRTSKMLEQHLLKMHNFYDPNKSKHRLLQCKKEGCKFMVIRVDAMYAHYKRHSSANKFRVQCPLCNVSYLRVKWLEGHMKKEHSTEDGAIPPVVHSVKNSKDKEVTESEGKTRNELANTQNNRKKNFTFECKHCCYKSKKKIALQKHMLGMHREHCTAELTSRLLRCPHAECDQEFVEHKALKHHLTLVHGHRSKVHVCGECGAEFMSASSLCGHMRQHKERNISCPYDGCEYKTHTNLHLKTHIKHKHMGEEGRDHLCHLCGYRCHSQGNLKLHLLNRHHLDLRSRRIRKKGQQLPTAVKNGPSIAKPRETDESPNSSDRIAQQGVSGYGRHDNSLHDSSLPNNESVTDQMNVMNIVPTSVGVADTQMSQESHVYLQGHSDLRALQNDLDNDLQNNLGVDKHLPVSQSEFYGQQNMIKTTTHQKLMQSRDCLPTEVTQATPQYDMRNQNYSYMNHVNTNTWHYQGDYNSHYLQPNSSSPFNPTTIHPEEYAQLMTHDPVDHTRNLNLISSQSETYLSAMDPHYNPSTSWKFK